MLRKLTFLASIIFVGNLSAAHIPIPVPHAVQRAYPVSDMKQGYEEKYQKRYYVIDSGTLYAMKDRNLHARIQPPVEENVVSNGTLLPYHASTADHIFGNPKGTKIKRGELYYVTKISAKKNGLLFTFSSFDLYEYWDGQSNDKTVQRLRIRFAMTPAQLAALTPDELHHLTDPFFTMSTADIHSLIPPLD
jgi:hypothetical protein